MCPGRLWGHLKKQLKIVGIKMQKLDLQHSVLRRGWQNSWWFGREINQLVQQSTLCQLPCKMRGKMRTHLGLVSRKCPVQRSAHSRTSYSLLHPLVVCVTCASLHMGTAWQNLSCLYSEDLLCVPTIQAPFMYITVFLTEGSFELSFGKLSQQACQDRKWQSELSLSKLAKWCIKLLFKMFC